jgi:hypothetical protein
MYAKYAELIITLKTCGYKKGLSVFVLVMYECFDIKLGIMDCRELIKSEWLYWSRVQIGGDQ